MTKAHILKNFFKQYFDYDASGNSPIQVLQDVMDNIDDLGGGEGKSVVIVDVIAESVDPVIVEEHVDPEYTWSDFDTWFKSGTIVFLRRSDEDSTTIQLVQECSSYQDKDMVYAITTANFTMYISDSESGTLIVSGII